MENIIGKLLKISNNGGQTPNISHTAYPIDNCTKKEVGAELLRRGLKPRPAQTIVFTSKIPTVTVSGKNMKA